VRDCEGAGGKKRMVGGWGIRLAREVRYTV
jgi:hypothetical protein